VTKRSGRRISLYVGWPSRGLDGVLELRCAAPIMNGMTDARKRVVASGYDRLAERYLAWGASIEGDPRLRMVAQFTERLPVGARVLDLGCGAGVPSTQELARRFDVLGVDISLSQVELARQNVPAARFIRADFSELQLEDASFDGAVALYAIPHLPREQHARLFADVFRWLVPGGVFLATLGVEDSPDWTGEWLGDRMFFSSHDAETNRRLLRAAGFELQLDEVATTPEPEGDVSFLWIVAQKPATASASGASDAWR
jgi:ubiquinone/menaquinone biosynthesis C-methylase UbiE